MILEEFNKIVNNLLGKPASKKVKPLYLKNKTLTVAALSSVLAQELRLNEGQIIRRLNEKFGKELIIKLRYLI